MKPNLKANIEILKLSTKEILLSFVDLSTPFFYASSLYRQSTKKYLENREIERSNFLERIRYLKKQGYIRTFTENKEKFLELTPKGIKRANCLVLDNINIERPQKWDQKWRVVIFDVPEKIRLKRNFLRNKLLELGFCQIQKSVYVFPFECTNAITILCQFLATQDYVTVMISEIIQGEESFIEKFIARGILNNKDLK